MRGYRKQEEPLKLLRRISAAKRRREPLVEQWRRNLAMLNGEDATMPSLEDRIDVNMMWATAHVLVPAIYFQDPDAIVRAKQPHGKSVAPILEAAIKHWMGELDLKRIIQSLIVDALAFPWAVLKIGYETWDQDVAVEVDPETGEVMRLVDESQPVQLSTFPIERRRYTYGERPRAARVSPLAYFFEPRATCPENSDWEAEEFIRHIDDLKADPRLENTRKLKPNLGQDPQYSGQQHGVMHYQGVDDFELGLHHGPFSDMSDEDDPDFEGLVRGYEFHHHASGRIYVVAEGHDFYLQNDWLPYDTRRSYRQLCLGVPAPDNPYPLAPFSVWMAQQQELNLLRSQQIDHVKRASPFYLVDVNRCDPKVQAALRDGTPLRIVPIRGSTEGIITAVAGAPMNPELHQAMADVKDDIRVLSGVAEFQRGVVSSGATATEQKLVASSVSVKVAWMRDQVSDLVKWFANGLKDLMQQFADKPTMIQLSGRSDFEWFEFNKDHIQGDFAVEIKAGSQAAYDPYAERKEATDELNLTFPIALQTGLLDPAKVLRRYYERVGAKDVDQLMPSPDTMKPPSDPQAEEILFSQGGTPTVSWNDEHLAHLMVHDAGIGQAKTPEERWRRMQHRQEHLRMAAMQGPAALGAQPNPGAPPSAGAPPGQPMAMGMGRPGTQPGQPMNPRQFAQKPSDMSQGLRVLSRGDA